MSKNCLVIVDVQLGFINKNIEYLPYRIAEFINAHSIFDSIVATRYCNNSNTACYTLGNWKECMSGTPEAKLSPIILPFVQRIFDKTTYSGFTDEFKRFIKEQNFDKLYFCGVNTDCCVLATVFSCYDNIQDCAVIADLCASTLGKIKHDNAIELLRDNITKQRVIYTSDFI